MIRWGWRHGMPAVCGGVLLLLLAVLTAPALVEIDVGGREEAAALSGVHGAEEHYGRHIRWTDGAARAEWSRQLGVAPTAAEIELAAFFGRAGEQVALSAGGRTIRHRMSGDFEVIRVPIASRPGAPVLEITSDQHWAPGDPRPLGVRLDRITFHNGTAAQVFRAVRWSDALLLVLAGAMAWAAGVMFVSHGTSGASRVSSLAGGLVGLASVALPVLLWRGSLLQPAGIRALAVAMPLGLAVASMLVTWGGCPRRRSVIIGAATAAIWLTGAVWSIQYFVDAPRWDIWETVPIIQKVVDGTLSPADLWGAHNEHRPMTGRLVVIASALLAGWNHWYELAALQAAAAVLLLVYTSFVARTQRATQRVHPETVAALAIFVCSATQWENWLRGYHIHILAGAIAPAAALLMLGWNRPGWRRLAAAVALGVVGQLSFGTGLIVWPVGALVIVVRRGDGWASRLVVWLVVGALATALYFPGLPASPGRTEGIAAVLSAQGLVALAAGTLVTVAMPVAYVPSAFATPLTSAQVAIVAVGAAAVLLFAALTILRWRQDAESASTWVFPAALGVFGLGACALAGLGRVSLGLYAMTASRYLVFAGCFWAGLLMLVGMPSRARAWPQRLALVLLVAVCAAGLFAWPRALPFMEADAASGRAAREHLRRGAVDQAAVVLYPDPILLEQRRQFLREHRLSVFRPGAH